MDGKKRIDSLTEEQLRNVLNELICSAEIVDAYQGDIFQDYRQMAESEMGGIIDTLVNLGKELK